MTLSQSIMERLIKAAAVEFNVTEEEIIGPSRKAHICEARFAVCFLGINKFCLSKSLVGEHLGGRDHTTLNNACERCLSKMTNDDEYFYSVIQAWESVKA